VKKCTTDSSEATISEAVLEAMNHDAMLIHVEADSTDVAAVDRWAGKIWDAIPNHGMMVVLFAGDSSSSKGICFAKIKK